MNYVTNTEELTSIADAIREKGGTSAPLEYPEEYVSAIEAISGGGGGYTADDIAMRTISGVVSGSASFIAYRAFGSYNSLEEANFQDCGTIEEYAFASCSSLKTVSFPSCSLIRANAFRNCVSLSETLFNSCTDIDANAFAGCISLPAINLPVCNNILGNAFSSCAALSVVRINSEANARKLSIADSAFKGCVNLVSLYLMGSNVAYLGGSAAFSSTPIGGYSDVAGRFGSIFVPASLYNSYLTSGFWSRLASRFVSV